MINEYNIPQRTKESLDKYVNEKIPTGGFLLAVLTNDLFEAVERADIDNKKALNDICRYIYNEMPSACWGSPQIVKKWLGYDIESEAD